MQSDMKELCNAIEENQVNRFILMPQNLSKGIQGKIGEQKDGKIYVEMTMASVQLVDTNETYSMHFQVIMRNFHLQMAALDNINKHNLFNILIENPKYSLVISQQNIKMVYQIPRAQLIDDQLPPIRLHSSKLFNQLNGEQQSAVANIVYGKNYPLPYLLYGPPGKIYQYY